ncbi:hypothetical protein BTW00_05410 [Psychrobacter sp. C 20.9]|nr:hypothetical protein BTW00_05410 [Psychrobacter sp. C 20.9]
MIEIMTYVGLYILILLAISMTVGFSWFLIIGRSMSIEHKAMSKQINERKELNGLATKHKIDL